MWRGPESGLPRGPRWLSAGLPVTCTFYSDWSFLSCAIGLYLQVLQKLN